jgi:hypothetical protein
MSITTKIAKAVVSELNKHDFSVDFEAGYSVKPGFELAELDVLRVVVVPKSLEIEKISRTSMKYTANIDIGIMQRIGKMTPEEAVDVLGELVDEISEFLSENPLMKFEAATFAGIANEPIYVPEHLTSNRTFTSVLTVKYMMMN